MKTGWDIITNEQMGDWKKQNGSAIQMRNVSNNWIDKQNVKCSQLRQLGLRSVKYVILNVAFDLYVF